MFLNFPQKNYMLSVHEFWFYWCRIIQNCCVDKVTTPDGIKCFETIVKSVLILTLYFFIGLTTIIDLHGRVNIKQHIKEKEHLSSQRTIDNAYIKSKYIKTYFAIDKLQYYKSPIQFMMSHCNNGIHSLLQKCDNL